MAHAGPILGGPAPPSMEGAEVASSAYGAQVEARPASPALGAVIDGLKLDPDMDEAAADAIRSALLTHKVIWFRQQVLDASSLGALACRFGTPTPAHPVEPSLPGHPEILPLDSEEGARADVWHSDLTFQDRPPLGALLYAVEVPPVGGDTIWADMTGAYDSLSAAMRSFLDTLSALHSPAKAGGYFAGRDATGGRAAEEAASLVGRHPVVRVHPETGRRSLFVNPLFTDRIEGLRRRESDALLELLYGIATAPERVVRWRWEPGDVAFWDNRCTMHYALLDFADNRRQMLRVALEGDTPIGPPALVGDAELV